VNRTNPHVRSFTTRRSSDLNHTATSNIVLGSHYLSGDGDNEGIQIDGSGNVGIGAAPSEKLTVNGNVLATNYLHSSDARLKKDKSEEHTSELQSRENLVCRL